MVSFNIDLPRPESFISSLIDDQIRFDLMFNLLRQKMVGEDTKRT